MMRRVCLALFLVGACSGGDATPTVSIVEVTPDEIDPALDTADDVTLRAEYHDGDADLGGGLAEVHDCRAAGLVTFLDLPEIASMEATDEDVPIEGTLTLVVADVGDVVSETAVPEECVAVPENGKVSFCLVVVDREGHRSEPDCTPPITVL